MNSVSAVDTMCKRCATELDVHIGQSMNIHEYSVSLHLKSFSVSVLWLWLCCVTFTLFYVEISSAILVYQLGFRGYLSAHYHVVSSCIVPTFPMQLREFKFRACQCGLQVLAEPFLTQDELQLKRNLYIMQGKSSACDILLAIGLFLNRFRYWFR